ncbi:MAG: (Fe-S)-binding protein [Oscillospiraceae bacterium]|nr:(Fe-S)-binding protein [Oscillospiraceae bacterium]
MGNNPWVYIGVAVLIAVGIIGGVSALVGLAVTFAAKRYSKTVVERFLCEMSGMLPGTDCGECGCQSCRAFADALLTDGRKNICPYVNDGVAEELESCAARFQEILEDPAPPEKRRPRRLK